MQGERRDALRACFAALPEADQQILRLIDYGGLSYAEAAQELGDREEDVLPAMTDRGWLLSFP